MHVTKPCKFAGGREGGRRDRQPQGKGGRQDSETQQREGGREEDMYKIRQLERKLKSSSLLGIEPAQCIAMGDGANDLPMMGVAGLSVAYHAKPKVREQAMVAINSGGLDRLLEVLR